MSLASIEHQLDEGLNSVDNDITIALATIQGEISSVEGFGAFILEEADRRFSDLIRLETREKRKHFTNEQVLERKLRGVSLVKQIVNTSLNRFATTEVPIHSPARERQRNPEGSSSSEFFQDAVQLFDGRLVRLDALIHTRMTEIAGRIDYHAGRLDAHLDTPLVLDIESAEKRRLFTKREGLEERADVISVVRSLRCSRLQLATDNSESTTTPPTQPYQHTPATNAAAPTVAGPAATPNGAAYSTTGYRMDVDNGPSHVF